MKKEKNNIISVKNSIDLEKIGHNLPLHCIDNRWLEIIFKYIVEEKMKNVNTLYQFSFTTTSRSYPQTKYSLSIDVKNPHHIVEIDTILSETIDEFVKFSVQLQHMNSGDVDQGNIVQIYSAYQDKQYLSCVIKSPSYQHKNRI